MKKAVTMEFGKRLKALRNDYSYTMDELCSIYNQKFEGNLNKGTLSRYENGLQEPLFTTVKNFSELFNASIEYMTGKSDDKYTETSVVNFKKVVPLLKEATTGRISEDNIEGYEPMEDPSIDFCLKVKDDSMIGARIFEGDIVYIDKDAIVKNGDIVIALVNGENTIKRFYSYGTTVILKPENPTMKEIEFNNKDKNLVILGKVKEVKFKLR